MPVIYKGFSLVELLIAMLLGSLLLAMVIGLYVSGVSNGAKSLQYSRLRTDLQSIISVMETDIRRAGYGGSAFMVGSGAVKTVDYINTETQDCIVYYYKHDAANADNNKMAFRFIPEENVIQFGTGVGPLAADCYASGNGSWQAVSDKQFIKITALGFSDSVVSSAAATMRSVQISITGELASDSQYQHSINTKVQVRNLEFNSF